MMISKELLGEVLETELKRHDSAFVGIEEMGISNSMVHINYKNTHGIICLFIINTYELAHKCKEWAFYNSYELFSRILSNDHQPRGNCLIIRAESDPEDVLKIENADSEPEAIFKSCEWILENKDKK